MKRQLFALAAAGLAAITTALPASAFTPQTAAATHALAWLHARQSADGTVAGNASRTEETVWGLIANHQALADFSTSGKTPIDSLRLHIADEEKSAGNIGSLIMAVAAAGLDPSSFAGRNLLQDLECTYNASSGAFNPQVFNDALAMLAVPQGQMPPKAVAWLKSQQNKDGGWPFSAGNGSDTNTTALAMLALKSANALTADVSAPALMYLKTEQRSDSGGFQYSNDSFVTDSDPSSDGLVIEALLADGQDPTSAAWSFGHKTALTDLLSFQVTSGTDSGAFSYARLGADGSGSGDVFSTTQPLVALTSTYLPVHATTGTLPATCPPTAPTSTSPTPTPTIVNPPVLARTGSSTLPPIAIGFALIMLGWRLRSRRAH